MFANYALFGRRRQKANTTKSAIKRDDFQQEKYFQGLKGVSGGTFDPETSLLLHYLR